MQDSQIVRMELKYCECCGGLLVRPAGAAAIYCAGCAARVRELAPPRRPKRRGRRTETMLPQVEACEAVGDAEAWDAIPAYPYEGGRTPRQQEEQGPEVCKDCRRPVEAVARGDQELWRTA